MVEDGERSGARGVEELQCPAQNPDLNRTEQNLRLIVSQEGINTNPLTHTPTRWLMEQNIQQAPIEGTVRSPYTFGCTACV